MKKIIFRNPFVTKKDKVMAYLFITIAENNLNVAERWCKKKEDGTYTDQGSELIIRAIKFWNMAAKRLGFRNMKDMDEYKNRHGRF